MSSGPALFASPDVLIIGGGVIGLSIAYELLQRGASVMVLERNDFGQRASWAGAGMLPPVNPEFAVDPLEKLTAISNRLHPQWANSLQEQTGINTGYVKCGAITLARTAGDRAALSAAVADWRSQGVEAGELNWQQLSAMAPAISDGLAGGKLSDSNGANSKSDLKSVFVPDEAQVCNPHLLQALLQGCREMGGQLHSRQTKISLQIESGKLVGVETNLGHVRFKDICLACGSWTTDVAMPLNRHPEKPLISMTPVRGQMLLYKLPEQAFGPIITEGSRYLVPRADGHVLVGSSLEEAGFDERTTQPVLDRLSAFAENVFPELNSSTFVKAWAGLRPATVDGLPYLGRMVDHENVLVATGHFRWGIQQSTGTGVVIADLVEGKTPAVDLRLFSPNR